MATFSAWYVYEHATDRGNDRWERGIAAASRQELMRKVERKCPRGYRIKAIYWERRGKSNLEVWNGRSWAGSACREAFEE